jgi:hypothetical protein
MEGACSTTDGIAGPGDTVPCSAGTLPTVNAFEVDPVLFLPKAHDLRLVSSGTSRSRLLT